MRWCENVWYLLRLTTSLRHEGYTKMYYKQYFAAKITSLTMQRCFLFFIIIVIPNHIRNLTNTYGVLLDWCVQSVFFKYSLEQFAHWKWKGKKTCQCFLHNASVYLVLFEAFKYAHISVRLHRKYFKKLKKAQTQSIEIFIGFSFRQLWWLFITWMCVCVQASARSMCKSALKNAEVAEIKKR